MGPAHPYNCWRKPGVIERELIQVVWGGGGLAHERESYLTCRWLVVMLEGFA